MTINSAKERERSKGSGGGGCRGDELIFGINPIASGSSFAFKKKIVKRQKRQKKKKKKEEEVPQRPSP